MSVKIKSRIKYLPWSIIADGLKRHANWSLVNSTPKSKIFERGNEKIIAVKLGQNKWKAEYFENGRLMDTSGTAEEEFVKRIIYEMGVFR